MHACSGVQGREGRAGHTEVVSAECLGQHFWTCVIQAEDGAGHGC